MDSVVRIGAGHKIRATAGNIADGNSGKRKLTVLDFIDTAADPAANKRNMDVHGEYSKAAQPTRCQASRMDMFAAEAVWNCAHSIRT